METINKAKDGTPLTEADLDANYTIDGYALTAASNTVSGVVDGITLNLKDVGTSTLSLSRDDDAIKESVQSFVDAYNALYKTIDSLSKNELSGDSTLRSIQNAIRGEYNRATTGLSGSYSSLVQIGINTDARSGRLSLDSSNLTEALDTDFQSVAELFADNTEGFAARLAGVADTLLGSDNFVKAREEGLRARIDSEELSILSWEARLELKETALRAKFASLDSLIGSMQGTMAFVSRLG